MINEIIKNSIEAGIPIRSEFVLNRGFVYTVFDFYKSMDITIEENKDGVLIAESRYEQKNVIKSPKDIVELNYYWWNFSKDSFTGWKEPTSQWKTLFDKYNLKY